MSHQGESEMRLSKVSFKLWHIMVAVAIVAIPLAVFEVAQAFGIGVMLAISVVSLPIALAPPARRLGVAAWVASLYPMLVLVSLYATWFTAWLVLSHRPSPHLYIEDPRYISPVVDVPFAWTSALLLGFPNFLPLLGLPIALLICPAVAFIGVVVGAQRERVRPYNVISRTFIPPFAWLSLWVVLRYLPLDRDHVIDWFLD
jgi:hypothetical protein